jgi:hypothetical protein
MSVAKKAWKLSDVVVQRDGKRIVKVCKLTHSHRQQRITIIPCPRVASSSFYNDWVYQDYVADHSLKVSTESVCPVHCGPALIFGGDAAASFSAAKLPDNIDTDIKRVTYLKREGVLGPIGPRMLRQIFMPLTLRERWHPWVRKHMLHTVGEKYLVHPPDGEQSFVIIMPAAQVPLALRTLEGVGFDVSDRVEVEAGDEATIRRYEKFGNLCGLVLYWYIYMGIIFVVGNESRRLAGMYDDYLHAEKQKWIDAQELHAQQQKELEEKY